MTTAFHRGSWIVTIPLGAIAAVYFLWVFLPAHRAIGETRQEIAAKQEQMDQTACRAPVALANVRTLEKVRAYTAERQKRVAEEKDLPTVYGQIHEAARAAGVATTKFDPQPAAMYEKIRRVPVVVGCSGSFGQIYEFLRKLEAMRLEMWVESVKMDQSGEAGKAVKCDVTLVLFTDNRESSDYVRHSD